MQRVDNNPSSLAASSCNVLHPITVRKVSEQMPSESALNGLADFFKLFSDKTRVIYWLFRFNKRLNIPFFDGSGSGNPSCRQMQTSTS